MTPDRRTRTHWRSRAFLGGIGYVCTLFLAGLFAGLSLSFGPSLFASGVPVLVPAALGVALIGALAAVLTGFGFRSPALVLIVTSPLAVIVEATSLRPSVVSLFDTWSILAPVVVASAGVEYGLRRRSSSIRFSPSTERALFGGALAAVCLLVAFSLRGVGPVVTLSTAGSTPSLSSLAFVLVAFGPPALLVWGTTSLVLRYGLLTPLVSLPAVGALLANPLGYAFSLFTAVSPLVFAVVSTFALAEYALRARSSSVRPRSLVG